MIDNITAIYKALHELPDELATPQEVIEHLSDYGTNFTRKVSVVRLTKATAYNYFFVHNGFGIELTVRTMHGPFTIQGFQLRMGMRRYKCVVIASKVTLKDYTHADKVEVEELLSKLSRLITDITLNYEAEV